MYFEKLLVPLSFVSSTSSLVTYAVTLSMQMIKDWHKSHLGLTKDALQAAVAVKQCPSQGSWLEFLMLNTS